MGATRGETPWTGFVVADAGDPRLPNATKGSVFTKRGSVVRTSLFAVAGAMVALAAWLAVDLTTRMPAFEGSLRLYDPDGEWRRVTGAALYDHGDYAYESGMRAFLLALETEELAQATLAAARFEQATRVAPANAYAWAMLAWAEAFLEDEEAAMTAQRRSWALAPFNATLSRERLPLVAAVERPLEMSEQIAVARDLRVAARVHPRFLTLFLHENPRIAALADAERLDRR
jgi:hypothetical protein